MSNFDAARRAALMGDLIRAFQGRALELVSFDEVREVLRLRSLVERGRMEVPIDAIVGTLGREGEFNRAFLPRFEEQRRRWEAVRNLAEGHVGFASVELYRVGQLYFVVDGHHRVSVARTLGAVAIEADVREFVTDLPLEDASSVETVLLDVARDEFREATALDDERLDGFRLTNARGYVRLLEHIAVHRYFLGIEQQREISWSEAVESWITTVHAPMVEAIAASRLLEEFPGRTATDLYLFVMDHLHYLREQYAPETIGPARAVKEVEESASHAATLRSRLLRWLRARL